MISLIVIFVLCAIYIYFQDFSCCSELERGGLFSVADYGVQPSSADSLILVNGSLINMNSEEKKELKVGFFNTDISDKYVKIGFGRCNSTVPLPEDCFFDSEWPLINSLNMLVLPKDSVGFRIYVTAVCEGKKEVKLPEGDYFCEIVALDCTDDECACAEDNTCNILSSTQVNIKVEG